MKTILLVDDESDVRSVLKLRLERSGYRVLESETGTHALEVVQGSHPDLIVLDWRLPGLTGIRGFEKDPRKSVYSGPYRFHGHRYG